METPYILISTISPEKGKKIDEFDKHRMAEKYFDDLSQVDRESG